MANRSYLCSTDYEGIYPSAVLEGYESSISTVASDVYCIPLLWPALFRAEDFFVESFEGDDDEGEFEACAPMAEKSRALANLAAARKWYAAAFKELGSLDEHFDLFERAIRESPGKFITVELEEIAALVEPPEAFYEDFEGMLAALEEPPTKEAADAMLELAQYKRGRPFPPARMLLDALSDDDEDGWNHCRVFGAGADVAGFGRPVPWEPMPTV